MDTYTLGYVKLALSIILLIGLFIIWYYAKMDTLDNQKNNAKLLTSGYAGGGVLNLWETTQPAQGSHYDSTMPSYANTWGADMMRESLVDTRCSSYGGDNAYLDKYLNIRNPDGTVVYQTVPDQDLYADPTLASRIAAQNKAAYDECRKTNNPVGCAPSMGSFVTDSLRGIAYNG